MPRNRARQTYDSRGVTRGGSMAQVGDYTQIGGSGAHGGPRELRPQPHGPTDVISGRVSGFGPARAMCHHGAPSSGHAGVVAERPRKESPITTGPETSPRDVEPQAFDASTREDRTPKCGSFPPARGNPAALNLRIYRPFLRPPFGTDIAPVRGGSLARPRDARNEGLGRPTFGSEPENPRCA